MIVRITQQQYSKALSLCDQYESDDPRFDQANDTIQLVISKALNKLSACHARGTFPRLRKKVNKKSGEVYKSLFLELNKHQLGFLQELAKEIKQAQPNALRIVLEWYLYDQLVILPKKYKKIVGVDRTSPNYDDSY